MQFKNSLINVALLGTERKSLEASELPETLKAAVQYANQSGGDNESQFLRASALAIGYLKAGSQPIKLDLEHNEAPEEARLLCSDRANALLMDMLGDNQHYLIHYWTFLCYRANQLIHPQALPKFLTWAKNTGKNEHLSDIIGNRGHWLMQFYPEWQLFMVKDAIWDTATINERVRLLVEMRKTDTAQARGLIQTTWKEENAAGRLSLLETLGVGIDISDEAFLKDALLDKSQKVKELALAYLKLIPRSEILIKYEEVLRASIQLSESKMLGLISKTSITVKLQKVDESLYVTGISKMSSNKKVSDEEQTLSELISEIHPDFWLEHFGQSEGGVVELFKKRKELLPYFLSLISSVVKFRASNWSKPLLEEWDEPTLGLLAMLPPSERRANVHSFFHHEVSEFVDLLMDEAYTPWSHSLAMTVISKTALRPASFSQSDLERLIPFLPTTVLKELDALPSPTETWYRNAWERHKEYLKTMIPITEHIKTAFA